MEGRELGRTPDERRQAALGTRFEARARQDAPEHAVHPRRLGLALQDEGGCTVDDEEVQSALESRSAHDELVGGRRGAQCSGGVEELAEDLRFSFPSARPRSDEDEPGVDAAVKPHGKPSG